MIVRGEGPRPCDIMVLGEAPGEREDETGRPFQGAAGKMLNRGLAVAGLDRGDVYVTNVVKERPHKNKMPTVEDIERWRPVLLDELVRVNPRVVIAAGGLAASQFLEPLPMEALHGIPRRLSSADTNGAIHLGGGQAGLDHTGDDSRVVIPTYHPAAPLHDGNLQTGFHRDWLNVGRYLRGECGVWQEQPAPTIALATDTDIENLRWTHRAYGPLADGTIGPHPAYIAIDTESPDDIPWGLSFATQPDRGYVILAHDARRLRMFSEAIQDLTALLHNSLHDLSILARLGVFPRQYRDTMRLARYIGEGAGLKALAYRLGGRRLSEYKDVIKPLKDEFLQQAAFAYAEQTDDKKLRKTFLELAVHPDCAKSWKARRTVKALMPAWEAPPAGPFLQYAGEDACATVAILDPLDTLTASQRDYEELDLAITPMVARMQEVGMPVDRDYLEDLGPVIKDRQAELHEQMCRLAGLPSTFNPASDPQVKEVIFGKLGFTPYRFSKKTGEASADKKVLEPLRRFSPFIDALLQWDALGKVDGTYRQALLKFSEGDSRVHARLDIAARSGRFTAQDPNLLAIPHHSDIGMLLRQAFRTRSGRVIASWDLSQIELRILAHLSQDPLLLRAFRTGQDLHAQTAELIFRVKPDEQHKSRHRLPSKTTNFGIVMGITEKGLHDQFGKYGVPGWTRKTDVELRQGGENPDDFWTEERCRRTIATWMKVYSGAANWFARNQAEAHERGHVVGMGGKMFWIEGIWCPDRRIVAECERKASALKIQGGAQYCIKRAMARIWQEILPSLRARGYIEPLLQIHDELLFEMDEALVRPAHDAISQALVTATPLLVPVECSGGYGRIWEGPDWKEL